MENRRMAFELKFPDKIKKRVDSGTIIEQKVWSYIKELNSFDDEHLDAVAIYSGYRDYTYRQMFRKWDLYAEVFSALDMTEKNKTCVGILPGFAPEAIFALYALNMTGASVSMLHFIDIMDAARWDSLIEKEGITDLIISDRKITPDFLRRVVATKKRLGIRNIIILHSRSRNSMDMEGHNAKEKANYKLLKQVRGVLFMPELLDQYEGMPIKYGSKKSKEDAIVLHTSGTTNGIHKPVPLSDRGVNESVARLMRCEQFKKFKKRMVSYLEMEPIGSYALLDMIHLPFSFGGGVVIPNNAPVMGPALFNLFEKYDISLMIVGTVGLEMLSKLPIQIDLSGIEFIFSGGGYLSAHSKKMVNKFLKRNGCKAKVTIGYGATEVGGACILSTPDRADDAIGFPLPGVKVKIYDDQEEKYYDINDGPREGGLMISSASVSGGVLNGIEFFKTEVVDGEKYINTFDRVRVNEDGSLNYVGRMNKYFVNNEGIRFDAGLVETAIEAQKGIVACGLVPMYDKMLHDTVPVLYVQTNAKGEKSLEVVKNAIFNVFFKDQKIKDTNMPGLCVIADNLPTNSAGKVDVYQIALNVINDQKYSVKPVRRGGNVVDVKLKLSIPMFGKVDTAPEELRGDAKLLKEFVEREMEMNRDNMPGQGMPGQGMPGQGMPGQGMPGQFMPFMPWGFDLRPIMNMFQNMAMMQGQYINQMNGQNFAQPGGMPQNGPEMQESGLMNDPSICNIMGMLFNASDEDEYYED
jgi:acyl-coenzyme A synthetase/AMP-(fatty) acid ligase